MKVELRKHELMYEPSILIHLQLEFRAHDDLHIADLKPTSVTSSTQCLDVVSVAILMFTVHTTCGIQ